METSTYYQARAVYEKVSRARYTAIADLLPAAETVTVLDIGCGGGALGTRLKEERNAKVYGLDVSKASVTQARTRLDGAWVCNIEQDQIPDALAGKKFDAIILSEVLEHLFDPRAALRFVHKYAQRDTAVIISVPNLFFWRNRLKLVCGRFRYTRSGLTDWGHIRFFTLETLKETLVQHGFIIEESSHVIPTRGTRWLARLFPNLFARQFVVRASRRNVVVYTAIFGDYDRLQPLRGNNDDVAFVCFTDNTRVRVPGWHCVHIESFDDGPIRSARRIKLLPHRFLPNYNVSIWVDGNMRVHGDICELVSRELNASAMAVYDHTYTQGDSRSSVYEEASVLIQRSIHGRFKDDPNTIREQMERYYADGYPDDRGLISSMIMLRRHNDPDVVRGMEAWWRELERGSRRDQLSFNYAMWKTKTPFSYIREDSRDNAYFKHAPHRST